MAPPFSMPPLARFLTCIALAFMAVAIAGCGTPSAASAAGRTVVPVAWIDGKHVVLSPTEIARIRPELAPLVEQRGLELVSDISSADYLVTIRYEPNPLTTEPAAVQIVSLTENRLRVQRGGTISEMDGTIDASRSAASSFPGGIGTSDPTRTR